MDKSVGTFGTELKISLKAENATWIENWMRPVRFEEIFTKRKAKKLIKDLKFKNFEGVDFKEISFIPKSIKGKSLNPKYLNTKCSGVELIVKDKEEIFPLEIAVYLLDIIYKNHPKDSYFFRIERYSFFLLQSLMKIQNHTE